MKIDYYLFGRITIDGKDYSSDVIIYPDRVDSSWWRKEGHRLDKDDLKDILESKPDVLIVGTGAYGTMVVPRETEEFLKKKGIKLIADNTKSACETFNSLSGSGKVVAALHLTC
jgi:hypothetical protein